MKIIGLYSSRPQCGKSTVANHLDAHYLFRPLKFAFPIKKMVGALLDEFLPPSDVSERLDGAAKERPIFSLGGLTSRRLMQTLGTEWGRALDADFWTRILGARLDAKPWFNYAIDDMRFPNEYDMLKRRGAIMVKIVRPHRPTDHEEGTLAPHASEGALDQHHFDHVIVNSGSREELLAKVDALANIILSEPHKTY